MQVEDVVDQKSLTSYLIRLERSELLRKEVQLARLALLNLLPFGLSWTLFQNGKNANKGPHLSPFISLLLIDLSLSRHAHEISRQSAATVSSIVEKSAHGRVFGNRVVKALEVSSIGSTFAVALCDYLETKKISLVLSFTESLVNSKPYFEGDRFWSGVRAILSASNGARSLPLKGFISDETNAELEDVESRLGQETKTPILFWFQYYQRILTERDTHEDRIVPIFNSITESDWVADPVVLSAKFDDVLAIYQAEDAAHLITATPHGERVVLDPETKVFCLEPTDQVDPGFLPEICTQIEEAVAIFGAAENRSNALQVLGEERDLLVSCIERYAARPVMILKILSRVRQRIEVKVANGDCPTPQQDANVADLQSIIATNQVELIALSPEVRRYHEATRPAVQEDLVPIIAEAAQQVAKSSDNEFAKLLTDAAFTLLDASADEYLRRHAQYWIVGSVTRSYKAAKVVLDEASDVTKKAGIVGAGVAYVMNPAFGQWISTVLRGFL